MLYHYIKQRCGMTELFRKKLREQPSPEQLWLAREYTELTERLSSIRANFDFVEDNESIDALIFEENAALARLSALYSKARAEGMKLEIYDLQKKKIKKF